MDKKNKTEKDFLSEKKKWIEILKKSSKENIKNIEKNTKEFLDKNLFLDNILDKNKISKNEIYKIYFVAGIFHNQIKTKTWKKFLENKFPNLEKEYFGEEFYFYLEKEKIEKIIFNLKNSLEKTLEEKFEKLQKENKKIIIFAHSFGGILSKTAISKLDKKFQEKIILVTMGTPHKIEYLKVREIKSKIKTPIDLENTQIYSFGGIYDIVVPTIYTHTKSSQKKDLHCEHLMFLYSEKIMNNVFDNIFLDF